MKIQKLWNFTLVVILAGITIGCSQVKVPEQVKEVSENAYKINKIIDSLPDGSLWIDHLQKDLIPFWISPAAQGQPVGNFPTYRDNKGNLVNPTNLPSEYKAALADSGLKDLIKTEREYVRAQARQTFAYGISYHMTGDEKYLQLAKAGVDYLRQNAIDRQNGSAYSYYDKHTKAWGPGNFQRTSQDMAYAVSGIGFYYYLTRDSSVLDDIINIKEHIWNTYYDPQLDLLRWVIHPSPDNDSPDQKELVSQLDQVYGYMLWLTPAMPKDIQKKWKKDLEHLASLIIEQFFSTEYGFFWGQITRTSSRHLGAPHTDFGHSIKTMWLIYRIGLYTDNLSLVNFARTHATELINKAYIHETGSWAKGFNSTGTLDHDKEWWSYAELDQTTATLGLTDPSLLRYLPHTYDYWFKYFVDRKYHGIWHMIQASDNKPVLKYPKVHSWKNSFHTFEHALIAYITTQEVKNQDIVLHWAFGDRPVLKTHIHPYFFLGTYNKVEVRESVFSQIQGRKRFTISFKDVR